MNPCTPEEVLARLIEAVEVIAATGKGDGPVNKLATWPDPSMLKRVRRRRYISAQEIARAEEALTWFSLIEDADARRALQFQVMCLAGGGNWSKICEKYGWKRTTVNSRNQVVLKKLSEILFPASQAGKAA